MSTPEQQLEAAKSILSDAAQLQERISRFLEEVE